MLNEKSYTSNHSINRIQSTNKHNPCPVCEKTNGNCRILPDSGILCMSFADILSGQDHPQYRYAKPSKDGLWGIYYPRTNNDFDRENWGRETAERQRERDRYREARSQAALSVEARDRDIQVILGQLTLNKTDRERLNRRGFTDAQINEIGYVSVEQWQSLTGVLNYGVNRRGNLNNPCEGILCPIRNRKGQLIALRLHNPNGRPKYQSFKGSNLKSGEFPIALYGKNSASGIVGISEGLEFKPAIASYCLSIPVIGHNGTTFTSSPIQTQATLKDLGASIIRLYPDGGVVGNPGLVAQYQKAIALYQSWGYVVEIAWWGQFTKADGDIDEIASNKIDSIQYLTPDEFLALCPGSQVNQFKKWIGKQFKRGKPKGFGVPKIEGETFEGDRASAWQQLIYQGYDVHDRDFMGFGKTHAVPDLVNPDGKIWYLVNDHRNPTVEGITDDYADLFPRNQYGFYRNDDGKLIKADEFTPKELIEIQGNCIKADLFPKLTNLGYDPNGEGNENPICAACPMAPTCKNVKGFYRHDRRETLKSHKIRCHPQSLPREFDYSKDIAIVDEPAQLLKPTKTIETYWDKLLVESDRYRENLDSSQWEPIDTVLQKIKPLFNNGKKWGLEHQAILEAIGDIDLGKSIESLKTNPQNLAELFPVADALDIGQAERKKHKGAYKTAIAHLRNEAYKESQTNLNNLPPNALIHLFEALNGDKGIVLRIKGETLSITLDNRSEIGDILSQFKARIYLDGTINSDRLIHITRTPKPLKTIRSKGDNPLENLKINQIKTAGIGSKDYSDTAINRIIALEEKLGDMPKIGNKSQQEKLGLDGYWFNHNRGSNDFAGEPNLMAIGLPMPNMGAIQDEYLAINRHLDGFDEYYARLVNDEILQLVGRQRVNRYPNQEFNLYFITPEHTDLSWLSEYGAKVTVKTAFEITPKAGNQKQNTRYRTVETIKQFIHDGIKITQTAIAKKLGLTPQAIQKTLREAGIELTTLTEKIQGIITTGPYKDSIRSSCNFDWAYQDLAWFFELPLIEVATEIIQVVKSGGMEGLKQYLDTFSPAIQGKFLAVLAMLMVDLDFEVDPGG